MTTPARDEALRDRVARALQGHHWYPGSGVDGPGCYCGWRTQIYQFCGLTHHEQHADHVADALLGVLADSRAEAWDEAHRVSCDMANNCWGGGCPLHENPYREEARDG